MALTEEQKEIISEALQPLFQYLEKEVTVDIARRIKKTLSYTRTAELQAMSMRELGYSPAKIRKEAMRLLNADPKFRKAVAKHTLEYKREIKKLINDITKEAYMANDDIIASAGNMSWINDLSVWKAAGKELKDNSYLGQLVESFSDQTAGELKNMTQTTGFKTLSGYEAVENAYKRELDKAVIKICSGTFSQEKVLRDVVHNLAQSGLRTIDFASGYSMHLDTAARLAIRTGCHQMAGKIMDKNMEQSGQNLVYVSEHWGARNTGTGHANHEQWQGKVYFIEEGKDYSAEAARIGQDRITSLWYATGYSVDGTHENDPLGMYGYHCRHSHHVWFEGISELPPKSPKPKPVTINGKTYDYYKLTQKMRAMERGIRALKGEKEALNALGLDTTEINAKIRSKTLEYRKFCRDAEINPKESRLRYEAGTSDLKMTVAYAKMEKTISKSQKHFDEMESHRKGQTHRKSTDGVEIIDEATYNKLIKGVKKNGGIIIRGTREVEEHLANNGSTASCIGDVILFSKNATISDVLEETYHFNQNIKKMNNKKPAKERLLLNEIDAQKYLLSVAERYHIPTAEQEVTRKNLADYEKELEKYYEGKKYTSHSE